jgi:hypothetical protein
MNAYERWGRFLDDKRYTRRPILRSEIELISLDEMVRRIERVRLMEADRCLACGAEHRCGMGAAG